MKIVNLEGPRVWRTYTGGGYLDLIENKIEAKRTHYPEKWILSDTHSSQKSKSSEEIDSVTKTEFQNKNIQELIEDNPISILGKCHSENFGNNLGILIKLIDSAERLTIQVHPDKKNAKTYFNSDFGKTESWYILGTESDETYIYLGFKEGITREIFKECFDSENYSEMLNLLHKIPVQEGDCYLIPGGTPHAIGKGCFILEVQEPTDITIRTERITPKGFAIEDFMCHQGLGFERMFDLFYYDGLSLDKIINKFKMNTTIESDNKIYSYISHNDTECFSISKAHINDSLIRNKGNFYEFLYVESGAGKLIHGLTSSDIKSHEYYLIPAEISLYKIVAESKELKIIFSNGPFCDIN